jgi:hypothetical protein
VRLVDSAGDAWKGPFRLFIADASHPGAACEAWTDAEGHLDPARGFLSCGLAAGSWILSWPSPQGPVQAVAQAAWRSVPVALVVRNGAAPGSWAAEKPRIDRIRAGLTERCAPRYRVVPAGEGVPEIAIRITGSGLDSLEGMRFASLRGELILPGRAPVRLSGEAGHADAEQARERALEDFLGAVLRALRYRRDGEAVPDGGG